MSPTLEVTPSEIIKAVQTRSEIPKDAECPQLRERVGRLPGRDEDSHTGIGARPIPTTSPWIPANRPRSSWC